MGNKPQKIIENRVPIATPSPCDAEPNSTLTSSQQEIFDRRKKLRKMSVTSMFTDISKYYDMEHKEIGHGQYGIVRKAIERSTHRKVAVKSILKEKVNNLDNLRNEINILRSMHHPNIVEFVAVHEDLRYLHIVTELCEGGELFERILQKSKYTEKEAAFLMKSIFEAVSYCHKNHIVHRDLKPENFLYLTTDEDSPIKVIDFGLSKLYKSEEEHLTTRVGTPFYIAPEVMKKEYGRECDMWSLGVILYILLCGYPPFYGNNDVEILRRVRRGTYKLTGKDWDLISDSAKDLIQKLIVVDPSQRLTSDQALSHPWILSCGSDVPLITGSDFKTKLNAFSSTNKLKRAALRVMANNLTQEQLSSLSVGLREIDSQGAGFITLDELKKAMEDKRLDKTLKEFYANIDDIPLDSLGRIDYLELLAATMKRAEYLNNERMLAAFRYFDMDDDGFITKDDFINRGMTEDVDEYFRVADLNHDDKIDYEEFNATMIEQTPKVTMKSKAFTGEALDI